MHLTFILLSSKTFESSYYHHDHYLNYHICGRKPLLGALFRQAKARRPLFYVLLYTISIIHSIYICKNYINTVIISTIICVVGSRYLVHYSDRQRQVGRGRQTTQYRKCWSAIHRHRDLDFSVSMLLISIISLNYKCKLSTHQLLCDLFSVNTLLKGPYFNISETLPLFSEYINLDISYLFQHIVMFLHSETFFVQRITEFGAVIFIRRRKFQAGHKADNSMKAIACLFALYVEI